MTYKITPEMAISVIEYTFDHLRPQDQLHVVDRLQHKTRKERWQKLVTSVRQRASKSPLSDKELASICQEVRQQRYAKKLKSSH